MYGPAACSLGLLGFILTGLTALLTGFTWRGALLRAITAAVVFGLAGYMAGSLASVLLRPGPGRPPPADPGQNEDSPGRRLDFTVPGTRPEELFKPLAPHQLAGESRQELRKTGFNDDR